MASLKGLSKKERKKRIAFLEQQLEKGSDSTAVTDSSMAPTATDDVPAEKPKSKKELKREERERMKKLKSERQQADKPEDAEDAEPKNE